MWCHSYYVYITTNPGRTTLYIGVTNDLEQRIIEHFLNRGNPATFAGRYYCYMLLYYEDYQYINDAIEREKELKGWSRRKKVDLINSENPGWRFLNPDILEWPPQETFHRGEEI